MKNTIQNIFPSFLSEKIIHVGKVFKKSLRKVGRTVKFGKKPFFKQIKTNNDSFFIQLNPINNGCVDEVIAKSGRWEEGISTKLESLLSPGDVFIDIGANIGYHSLFVASLHNQGIAVHSFEPISALYSQFQNSVDRNNFHNITIHNNALGKTDGEVEINLRDENMGGSSLFEYENIDIVPTSGIELVKMKTLDSIFDRNMKVDVIKIDIEGYEFEALSGGKNLLETHKPTIIMEFSPLFYKKDYPNKATDFIVFLENLEYSFETIGNESINLHDWLTSNKSDSQIDLVCRVK